MEISNFDILVSVLVSVLISLIAYFLYLSLRKARYDKDNNKVILEGIRNSLEQKMYVLNDRLVQNEERWRDVNHLLLTKNFNDDKTYKKVFKTHYSEFLKANGISKNELNIDDRLVFVLTPFNERFNNEFMIVKNTCESIGFTCLRGDEEEFKGDIFPQILKHIVRARIIIANLNGRNPNVLYELGVAQAMDKSVILISKEPEDLPIDIQSQKFLIYSDFNILTEKLKQELEVIV